MASTLDKLRQLANQNYTQEQAQQVINQNYDFDSWRQEDASLITPEYRSIIEENRRRYEQNVAPALEYNRQREAFLREYGMYPEEYERQQRQTPSGISKEDLTPTQLAIDRILGVDRTQVTGEDTNWLDIAKGAFSKGMNQWNSLNWKTADFLLGGVAEEIHALGTETVNGLIDSLNMIPGVNIKNIGESKNFISRMNEDAQRGLQNATDKYTANANSSRAAQIADQFGTSLVAAIPLALEAFLLGPTQAAAAASSGASTAGLTYFSGLQSATGATAVGMMAKEGLTKLVRNPQFWTSYLQVAGDGYESALEDGMKEEEAAVYGLVNGFFNSIIEIGGADETLGGIQNLPMRLEQMRAQGGKKAVVEWFKDAVLGEGKEEVLQGMFERGSKSFFGEDVPLASLDPNDQRAIFNPYTAGQEFTGGAVVGLGLGGGQVAADRAIRGGTNAVATAIENRQQTQAQQRQETEATFLAQVVRELDVSKAASQVLVEGYGLGDADAQSYARGIQEAVKLGEMGIPYAQAREESVFGQKLNDTQFQHAWQIGQQKSGRAAEEEAPQRAVTEYGSIEDFSREFKSPEKVTEIYDEAADTDVNEFAAGFRAAYDMGQSGVSANYLTEENIPALTETQRTAAFELGRTDAESTAVDRDLRTVQRQKPGNLSRVKGTVRGEGVTIADMKKAFNDSQNTAYRLLTRYAETTGVNIVLYNSQADTETGLFPDAQGRFQWKDDTIYIDINSGLNSINDVNSLGKYTMLRTFGHEFTHFIEKWNASEYNSFREMVFSTLEAKGENVHDLIEAMQARDASGKMTYEQASREVIADGMMDILQDSTLVQQLAEEQPNVFKTLLKKLREFAARMKQYYREISTKAPREAQALKENNAYLENIVKMWDQIAKGAVQNYQGAYGETLFDQPAKPANLPKRTNQQKNAQSGTENVQTGEETAQNSEKMPKRAGMNFFQPVDVTEEEAPKLSRMAAKNNRPVSRDRFPANDLTSQAEQGPDLKNMVPRAQEAPQTPSEEQTAPEEPEETPAAAVETQEAVSEAAEAPAREESPAATTLRNRLSGSDSVDFNGFRYEIFGMRSTTVNLRNGGSSTGTEYRGTIRRVSTGGPVADGRTVFDRTFDDREEAVDYMVSVAENNHLLEEAPSSGKPDGNAQTRKTGDDNARLAEGSEGVRGGSSGRETAASPSEIAPAEGSVPERGDSGAGRVPASTPDDRGSASGRNGRNDRNGDGGRLQSGSNASGSGRKNGAAPAGVQGTVPLKSPSKQNARNYHIEEDIDSIRPNIQDNIAAIKLVKKLIAENRPATDEERAVLAKYKGWGGLKNYILDRQGYWARQIQQLLTPEEYETARDSVLNAHYTSTKVIAGIYKAVQRMGFKGGNILEPSMGVGNFFGMLPKNLSSRSSLYGVELDKITGTIAKNLYPDARIDVAGFQDILYGDGTFDLVVGNVPFSNDIKIPYRGTKFNLHDFFFVKALDETRPGGVLALITSTGTLDKLSGKTQTAIAERANLIAAFRLPDNAFLSNAGTSVTTDLVFLQRKGPGVEDNGIRFTEIGKIDGVPINEYYVEHPENVLGELAYESGMYASERTVVHATRDFEARFNKAMESLPKNLMAGETKPSGSVSVQKRGERKRTTFRVTDKGVSLVDTDGNETKMTGKPADVAKKYVEIKQLYFATYEAEQNGNIDAANQYREKLNKSYDAFTKKYGTLEKNKKALGKDDEFLRVSGLEIVDKEGNVYKSAIFERPTLYRERKTSADTSSEGLSIVLNETGRVDAGMIADLTGKSEEEVVEDLKDEIIFTPDGIYELMPKYLSGNIYQKLEAVEGREGFERQAELLRSVLPKPKTARDIDAEISSHWIPPKYISQFVKEVFQPYGSPSAKYVKELGKWDIEKFWSPIRKWSTGRVDAFDLLLNTLNNKHIVVNDTDEDGKKVFNKRETEIAQSKQNDLRSAFREWIFKDEERRADLEDIFNRTLNAYAPMNFNALADKIDFGIDPSSKIKLRDYQKAAVARIVFGGNTLLHHGVGTGKTATMITAAHVLKSTGVSKKPMFVVPNGKVLDFKREILGMYPGARILALDADLLSPRELKRTKALIATNDWDYVLIHKSGFQKIGVSPETTAAFIEQQIEELETAIRESNADAKRGTRFEKNLITKKKNLEEKLKKILESPKDESTTFENMGIDALFVDEAHNFKKVGFATTQEISGVDSSTNGLTTDLYMKENWLRDRGGRIVLATATPITNTVSEMYNMTLHVNPDILREAGVYAFDGWLNTFGDMRSEMEIASDGKTFRMKERIQDFKNANELISLYRQFADVKQTKDVVKDLPKAEDVTVICSGNEIHRRLLDNFAARMEKVGRGNKDDNALNVNNDAKAAATDLRMVSSLIQELFPGTSVEELDLPDSKINKCVGYIVDEYRKSMKNKGTQLVFLDSGMGRGNTKRYTFNLYGDLISKLVKNGIPREQIADIGDYDGDAAKQKLYDLVNDGTIRVLIGSTAKMGEGVNVQNKIVAIHHLSVPMRADNLEQRDGRGIRHGNENKEVRIYKYIQEPSYDSYLWQMIERKSKYMAQALNGGDASDLEEISNVMVNAKQSKALATGNPAIMEKFKLEDEIATLRTLENAYNEETREAAHTAAVTKREIENYETRLELLERDQRILEKNQKDDFELTVGKKTYDKRTDAATALFSAFIKDNAGPLGSVYGLKISKFTRDRFGKPEAGIVFNDNPYTFVSFGDSPEGNITRLVNGLGRIGETIEEYNKAVSSLQKTVADAEKTAARSEFPRTQELSEKLARLTEINRELGINTGEVEINVTSTEGSETGDDNVEYSLRAASEEGEETPYNSRALVSSETIEKWLDDYAASNPDYAQAYITYMDPRDFLRLTTSGIESRLHIEKEATGLSAKAAADFSRGQPIQMHINSETGKVEGHEGRHRMVALQQSGIGRVPVLLFDYKNKYSKTPMKILELKGQDFNGKANYASEYVHDLLPFNRKNITAITEKFSEPTTGERISAKYGSKNILEFSTRREPGLSNREILGMAASDINVEGLTDAEKNALDIFKGVLTQLEGEQEHRKDLGRQYKDQQFTRGGSRAEADRIRAAMSVSDSKIKSLENRLLSLENKNILKQVLVKARGVVEQQERKRGDEKLQRYRERRNESASVRKYRERVRSDVETLRKWLVNPSNKDLRKHVPAEIQKTVADFLESINLMSPTALRSSGLDITKADERYLKDMKKMRDAIKHNVDSQGLYSGYADLPQDFIETFEALIAKTEQHISSNSGEFVVNQMTAAELKDLHQTLKTLRKFITTMNMFHNNAMFRHAYDAGEDTIQHLTSLGKSKKSGAIYKFLRFDYMRPSYAFEHFGKGGQSIEHEFREGQATQAFLANKIIDFAKKTYTAKEVKAWSEETKSFETSDGETVTMPITHLMSLYCLNKRPQALTHIYGDGIRVANYKDGKVTQLDEGHIVTIDDVQKMIQELTPRQREVADALQKYISTETAIWGNYVSMKRFDVEQFTEENYFPINSDGRYLATTADESPETAGLYALLNSSFTKELKENADNRIILYNIFDVFANHTASMTQYRSFALPVLDALKWFNYKNDTTSVRTKLSSAFGAPLDERAGSGAKGYAEQFVINLLKAYNATAAQGDPYDTIALRFLHRYNGAAIAYNLRVIIQQPTAIARAAMILSPAKLSKGLGMSVTHLRTLAEEMEKHSGIAAWKALGFYDTNISRGLTDLIKQNPGVLDQVMEVGTKGAEAADRLTWAAMWYAAKDSVKRSDYATEDEYFKAVTELFEDVIYKTQVVDSLLTKAEFLRSKGAIARQMGSFMSEPSATMSMLSDAYYKYTDDLQRGMSRSEAWKKNGGNIAKTAAVYAVGQVLLSAMQAVIDAWRDNDDKDPDSWIRNYLMKYLDSFKGNVVDELLPFGKVPIVSELYEVLKGKLDDLGVFDKLGLDLYGNDISSGLSMYLKYLEKAWDVISDKIQGKSTNYTNYSIIYNLMRGVSNLTGIPLGSAWREVQDVWNNTVGFLAPDKKLVTYQRAADKAYSTYIKNTGLSQKDYQAILDDADKVFGDNSGTYKQDEVGAALVAALEDGKITEEQAAAIWRSKWHKENNKTFDDWRSGGKKTSSAASTMTKPSPANSSPAPMRPAAGAAAASTGNVSSYEDFKKVIPVYGTADKEALYNVWNSVLTLSGMSLDRFTEILANADTDGNKSIKQAEMGEALYAAMQRGELSFEQCDAVWRSLWNKARSKTFAKWLNG